MHSHLRHVESALEHCAVLVTEARSLGATALAHKLEDQGHFVEEALRSAEAALDEVEPARRARQLAHHALESLYNETSSRLEELGCSKTLARLAPGGQLDVVERMRYRLRRLMHSDEAVFVRLRDEVERGLLAYETCVDVYLLAAGEARLFREQAVSASQLLRLALERAKRQLLTLASPGSEVWLRVRRRCVRTKPPRWLAGEAQGPAGPSSLALRARGQLLEPGPCAVSQGGP
ncbi:MAG: hypothetical protein ACO3JL_03870 [Myxococcota bacterium]